MRTKEEQPPVATVAQQLSPPHHRQESDRPGTQGPWRARRHQLSLRVSQKDHGACRTQQGRNTKDQPGRGSVMDPEDPELPAAGGKQHPISPCVSAANQLSPYSGALDSGAGLPGLEAERLSPAGFSSR